MFTISHYELSVQAIFMNHCLPDPVVVTRHFQSQLQELHLYRADHLLAPGQRESTDRVDFLRDHHLARSPVGDHPQQLGAVGASIPGCVSKLT